MMDTRQAHQQSGRRFRSGAVRRLFQSLELDTHPAAGEISASLAAVVQEHRAVSAGGLALLAARSFCAVGDREAAARILRHDAGHCAHAGSWLRLLSAACPFPELYPLLASRALRPQCLASAGTIWVLDLDRIQLTAADRHELILHQTVRVLTEKISAVWAESDGQGTLGVKGLRRLDGFIRSRRTACRLVDHIREVLAMCARKNGWVAVPAVLLFDL